MSATVTPLRRPTQPHDPALLATLAELSQLGLAVARAASRLADVETAAADALAADAASTTRALSTPPASLAQALSIGQNADLSEAARDAAIARVAIITECFNKAARAVRCTVALQARLAAGHAAPEFRSSTPQNRPTPQTPASRPRPANDADNPDRPESGDELGAKTNEEVLHGIHRDLSRAAANAARLTEAPGSASITPPPPTPIRPAPAAPLPDDAPGPLPSAPDT